MTEISKTLELVQMARPGQIWIAEAFLSYASHEAESGMEVAHDVSWSPNSQMIDDDGLTVNLAITTKVGNQREKPGSKK